MHDRRHLVDASVSANTRHVYANVALPPRRGDSMARPLDDPTTSPSSTTPGTAPLVRRSRAPPSRSGLLTGRGRPASEWSDVSPHSTTQSDPAQRRVIDRLPDVMVDDHKVAGRCFHDADGDLRGDEQEPGS